MILYHGTRGAFDAFDAALVGGGAEANSALGIWATRCPHAAAQYGGDRRLIVLEIAAPRLAAASDYATTIWGGPDLMPSDREIGWARFAAARRALSAAGFDGVWCEMPGTDLEAAACLFDLEKVRIVRVIDFPEERDLLCLEDPEDDSTVDFSRTLEGGGRRLLTMADAFAARAAVRTGAGIEEAMRPLVEIADAYDANELDDDARKFWGADNGHTKDSDTGAIELVCDAGGSVLLTLKHALEARSAASAREPMPF